MSTITAVIPSYPIAPDPALHGPTVFPTIAAAFVLAIKTAQPFYNTMATEMNTVASEVNVNANLADTKAGEAAASALAASGSASTATTQAGIATTQAGIATSASQGYLATSTTSNTVGTGAKSFTVAAGKNFVAGDFILVRRTSAPATTWMHGTVTSYSGTSLVLNITKILGSGVGLTDWTINLSGPDGVAGTGIVNGTNQWTATGGTGIARTLTVDANASISQLLANGISNIATATASVSLTSTKTLLDIVPATLGCVVNLPDATTCSEAGLCYAVQNDGSYDVAIRDFAFRLLGFVRPGDCVLINLFDNAASSGDWQLIGAEDYGVTAAMNITNAIPTYTVEITASKDIIFSGGSSVYGTIHDKTDGTFGTPTLISTSCVDFRAQTIDSGRVLFVSLAASTVRARVLSISGKTITVNAEDTEPGGLTTNTGFDGGPIGNGEHQAFYSPSIGECSGLLNVSSLQATTWVCKYKGTSGNMHAANAIQVSGTTATVGATINPTSGSSGPHGAMTILGGYIVMLSPDFPTNNNIYVRLYSISGTTLTQQGAAQSLGVSPGGGNLKWGVTYGGAFIFYPDNDTSWHQITVSGTTVSRTSVSRASVTKAWFQNGAMRCLTNSASLYTLYNNAGTLAEHTLTLSVGTNVGSWNALLAQPSNTECIVGGTVSGTSGVLAAATVDLTTTGATMDLDAYQNALVDTSTSPGQDADFAVNIPKTPYNFAGDGFSLIGKNSFVNLSSIKRNYRGGFEIKKKKLTVMPGPYNPVPGVTYDFAANIGVNIFSGSRPSHGWIKAGAVSGSRYLKLEMVA
jgi:hypothetical protein